MMGRLGSKYEGTKCEAVGLVFVKWTRYLTSRILWCSYCLLCMHASHMPLCQHVVGNVAVPQRLSEQSIAKVILSLLKSLYYWIVEWSDNKSLFCWCHQNTKWASVCVCVCEQNLSALLTLLRSEESVLELSARKSCRKLTSLLGCNLQPLPFLFTLQLSPYHTSASLGAII